MVSETMYDTGYKVFPTRQEIAMYLPAMVRKGIFEYAGYTSKAPGMGRLRLYRFREPVKVLEAVEGAETALEA